MLDNRKLATFLITFKRERLNFFLVREGSRAVKGDSLKSYWLSAFAGSNPAPRIELNSDSAERIYDNIYLLRGRPARPQFRAACPSHMKHCTLCYVCDGSKILLGVKKRCLGAGNYNGFGGKVEQNETVEQGAIRELREECGIIAESVKKQAELSFSFPHKPEWTQIVHVFVAVKWSGTPVETEEMAPAWFEVSKIPYDKMWVSDPHWLPHVLDGKFVTGRVVFSPDGSMLEKEFNVK